MKSRVLVLHSGPSGRACECALGLAGRLHEDCYEVVVADLSRFLASHILSERALLVCLENSGRCPSEEVLDFVDFLSALEVGSLSGLKYAVLCVDHAARRRWQNFGRQIDGLLEMLGAHRIAPRAEGGRSALSDPLSGWLTQVSDMLAMKPGFTPAKQ